jgi:hypothetical protein
LYVETPEPKHFLAGALQLIQFGASFLSLDAFSPQAFAATNGHLSPLDWRPLV